jgi:hypothetical protein
VASLVIAHYLAIALSVVRASFDRNGFIAQVGVTYDLAPRACAVAKRSFVSHELFSY